MIGDFMLSRLASLVAARNLASLDVFATARCPHCHGAASSMSGKTGVAVCARGHKWQASQRAEPHALVGLEGSARAECQRAHREIELSRARTAVLLNRLRARSGT